MYQNEQWGRAADNLAKMIAGDSGRAAQIEATQTQALSQQQEDRHARGDRRRRIEGAEAWDDPRISSMVASGDPRLQHVGDVLMAEAGIRGAQGGLTPDQMRSYQVGAGRDPSEAISGREFDMVADRDHGHGMERDAQGYQHEMDELRFETQNPTDREGVAALNLRQGGSPRDSNRMAGDLPNTDEVIAGMILEQELGPRTAADMRWGHGSGGGGGTGGGSGDPNMADSQRRQWAAAITTELEDTLADRGVHISDLDDQTREQIVNFGVREGMNRPDSSPQALTLEALDRLGADYESGTRRPGWLGGRSQGISLENPHALMEDQGDPRQQQGGGGGQAPGPGQGRQDSQEVPPPQQRTVGRTYQTPRGPAVWEGNGWRPVEGGQ